MTDPIIIYRKTTGLNTLIDPVDLDISEGVQELAVAADVMISDKGRLSRRKGYTSVLDGSYHSLFCDGGDCICVTGTSLCLLNPDYSTTIIGTVTADARLNACQVNNQIFWCNGYEKGFIYNKVNYPWVKGDYVWPTTHRTFFDPPTGTLVEHYNGRLYVAQGNTLWFSEPLGFGVFDLTRGVIPYASNIRMIRAVDDGLFISTENRVVFLSGSGPNDFSQIQVAAYPAIEGTDAKFHGDYMMYQPDAITITKSGKKAILWTSEEGICFGGSGGKFDNVTEEKIHSLPSGVTGSGIIYNGKYLGLIDP